MKYIKHLGILSLVSMIFIMACTDDKGKKIIPENLPKVSSPIVQYHDQIRSAEDVSEVLKQYPVLSDIVFQHIVGIPKKDSASFMGGIHQFLQDETTSNIYGLIDSVYSNMDQIQSDWNQSMALLKHYFPDRSVPTIYTLQTNLGVANFMFEDHEGKDAVAASLDFFLGSAFPYIALAKENPAFSAYNNRTFNKDHLVTKSMNALIDDILGETTQQNFLSLMIRDGKRLYLLEQLSPHLPDSAIFEYTPEQLQWCQNNEFEIWNFFLEMDLLYETTMVKIAKYLQPAPTSQGMPAESPGRTGAYIGYKIVDQFMKQNEGVGLHYLVEMNDPQEILDRSKYKPRIRN